MNRTTAKTIWKAVILILILMSVSLVMFQTIQISGSQSEHINDLSRGWYYIQEGEKTEITLPAEIKSTDKVILYHENVENYQKEFLMFKGAEYQPVIYAYRLGRRCCSYTDLSGTGRHDCRRGRRRTLCRRCTGVL